MNLEQLYFDLSVKFEFGSDQRYKFYRKLSQLLSNGVNLDTALKQIENIARKKRNSIMPKLYKKWRHNISNGMNFGQCLTGYIPNSEAILLETGANSGRLVEALENSAQAIEQQTKVKKAIISAAAYPALLLSMLIAALLLSSYKVIPVFLDIVPIEEWTGISYIVAVVTQFIRDYIILLAFLSIALTALISFSMSRWVSKTRLYFDQIPPWSLYRMWQGSSFLLAISSMMRAGVKLDEVSLGRIAKQSDPYLKQRIRGIIRYITAGENLGDALNKSGYNFPDEEIISDLQIYAKLRGFDENLIWIVQSWVDSLVEQVTITMKIVNTLVLFLIAIVIGCLILAFYDIFQQVQTR